MRRRRIMWMHSFAMTFVECHRIIRGISNIASLVRTCLQQWDNMQKRIFLYRCAGSNFFFLRRIIIVYIRLLLNMTVSSYSVIFIFARCSAKNISSCYFFQNVIRANNYIYAKEKRNFLKKVKNSHVVCCTSILRCKPRAILQRKLKYWRLKSTDKTRNGKILRS